MNLYKQSKRKNGYLVHVRMHALFLTTNNNGSDIFQFNLSSSFDFIKQWNPPKSCDDDELIHNIAYNNGTLAVIISHAF